MKHALSSINEKVHYILEVTFVDYAKLLRSKYPDNSVRNAAVFASGVPEFARLGYIERVDARSSILNGLPPGLVRTIKRAKHQPIWIPGPNFPDDPRDIYEQMQPSLHGDEIIWQHFSPKRRSTWRNVTW